MQLPTDQVEEYFRGHRTKMLSDEGSNSVQRQPQRLKAFVQKLLDSVFITNLAQKPSAYIGVFAKILQNSFLSHKVL